MGRLMNRTIRNDEIRLAVLIDGDNVQASQIEFVMKEVVKYGIVTIRRIYGDWTTPQLDSWKKKLPVHAIQPVQQFRNTIGKNATDSAMIIDAMDILYSSHVEGFIIVSSDSDYTKLAIRLREAGMNVVGIGKNHTPKPFVNACNEFIYVENIMKTYETGYQKKVNNKRKTVENPSEQIAKENNEIGLSNFAVSTQEVDLGSIVMEAHKMVDQESSWVDLRKIANNLKKLDPAFDPRTYGYSKLSKVISSHDSFEVRRDRTNKRIMVRVKDDMEN